MARQPFLEASQKLPDLVRKEKKNHPSPPNPASWLILVAIGIIAKHS